MAEFAYTLKDAAPGGQGLAGILMGMLAPARPMQADGRRMTVRALLTSEMKRDRQGDIVAVEGMDTSSHELNPCVLYDHGRSYPFPIAVDRTPEGVYTVEVDPYAGEIWHTAHFSQRSAVAEQVFALIEEGMLAGCSAGFRPIEWQPLPPDEEQGFRASKDGPAGKLILRSELVECSFAAIPVNGEAARAVVGKSWCNRPLDPAIMAGFRPWLPERRSLPVRGGWDVSLASKAWSYTEKAPGPPPWPGAVFDPSSHRWTNPDKDKPAQAAAPADAAPEMSEDEAIAELERLLAEHAAAGGAAAGGDPAAAPSEPDPRDAPDAEAYTAGVQEMLDAGTLTMRAIADFQADLREDMGGEWRIVLHPDTMQAVVWHEDDIAEEFGDAHLYIDPLTGEPSMMSEAAWEEAREEAEAEGLDDDEGDGEEGDSEDAPSGSKAWSYADAGERAAVALARKSWAWAEKARTLRAEGETWTSPASGVIYTKRNGQIRRVGKVREGGAAPSQDRLDRMARGDFKRREAHQGPARPKGDPARARAAVAAHLAKGDAATADDVHALASTLRGLTVAEITAIKKEAGVKASGVKWDLAAKVADRIIAAVRAKAQTEGAKEAKPPAVKPDEAKPAESPAGKPWGLSFRDFLKAPRDEAFISQLRRFKAEIPQAEREARAKMEAAEQKAAEAGLDSYDLSGQNPPPKSKAKRDIIAAFKQAENEWLRASGEGREAKQRSLHRQAVAAAMSEGKPVPPEVLADYPDLQPKPADPAKRVIPALDEARKQPPAAAPEPPQADKPAAGPPADLRKPSPSGRVIPGHKPAAPAEPARVAPREGLVWDEARHRWVKDGEDGKGEGRQPAPAAPDALPAGVTHEDVADAVHELNAADPRTGMTPLIPKLYEQARERFPGLTREAFHAALKRMSQDDQATLQPMQLLEGEDEHPDRMLAKWGHPLDEFPAGEGVTRHGGPAQRIFTRNRPARGEAKPAAGAEAESKPAVPVAAPRPSPSGRIAPGKPPAAADVLAMLRAKQIDPAKAAALLAAIKEKRAETPSRKSAAADASWLARKAWSYAD